jgi:hypothetical protein
MMCKNICTKYILGGKFRIVRIFKSGLYAKKFAYSSDFFTININKIGFSINLVMIF